MPLRPWEIGTRQSFLPVTSASYPRGWNGAGRATQVMQQTGGNSGSTDSALQHRNQRRFPAESHRDCRPRTQTPVENRLSGQGASLSPGAQKTPQHKPRQTGTCGERVLKDTEREGMQGGLRATVPGQVLGSRAGMCKIQGRDV